MFDLRIEVIHVLRMLAFCGVLRLLTGRVVAGVAG